MLPLVITVRSVDGSTRRYAFAESPVSIGRSPFAELQLIEPFVSRWEGTVRFDEREVTYFVLGSTNPTYVDGREVTLREQDLPIGVNSVLAIGELELRFSREPVPEADIRRKGKRRPTQDARQLAEKTMYLAPAEARVLAAPRGDAQATAPDLLRSTPGRDAEDLSLRTVVDAVRELDGRELETLADDVPAPPRPSSSTPPRLPPSELSSLSTQLSEELPAAAVQSLDARLADLYRDARGASSKLVRALTQAIEEAPLERRASVAEQLQRRYPRAAMEPEFRGALKRLGLPLARTEVPEVREWLLAIGEGVLPASLQIDSGLTLERIFRLLELLSQSLAEINSAQDSVRSRWLGRPPRRSVLRSENGRVVLTYLLNPKADWGERVAELEQTVREAVTHELALFKATLEASRKLVESLSPERIEHGEPLEPASADAPRESWWQRLRGGNDAHEARLWRRLVSMHEALLDGNRYQRLFLGRMFAHRYLVAMGQGETPDQI